MNSVIIPYIHVNYDTPWSFPQAQRVGEFMNADLLFGAKGIA
jgi:hypothetical protein